MLIDMFLLKLIESLVLKWIYIYDEVGSNVDYLSEMGDDIEIELYVEGEVDHDNEISVGKYDKHEVDMNIDDIVGWDVHKSIDSEVGRGNDVRNCVGSKFGGGDGEGVEL